MVAAVKKGCSRGGRILQVRFGDANVRRIVDVLTSSIDPETSVYPVSIGRRTRDRETGNGEI
jgi:hypothetical protein